MRDLQRNKSKFYYALYSGVTELTETINNESYYTGEYQVTFGKPVECHGNISPASGTVQPEMFGLNIEYDKVIVMADPDTPIQETSVLWIDTMPTLDASGATTTPYDYTVSRIARSLNGVAIAVKKVE